MEALLNDLIQLLQSAVSVAWSLLLVLKPLAPLSVWIVFWLFAVNWVSMRRVLLSGGWVGVVLVGMAMVLVWGTVSPPESGTHSMLGLTVGNFVGKTVYVSMLITIMLLCGAVQLSGSIPGYPCKDDEQSPEEHPASH